VDDIVHAYLALAARAADAGIRGEVFHFATGTSTTALEIVERLCELAGRPGLIPLTGRPVADERINQVRSTGREREVLGWTSQVDLDQGLHATLDWYRHYFGAGGHGA
jgi:nucleoside-diphosphate-sugar epimerase